MKQAIKILKRKRKKKKKIRTKPQKLKDQNVTGNLTAIFTTSEVTTRMTDSFAHPFVRQKKPRGSYLLFQWTNTIYFTTLKIIIFTQIFKCMWLLFFFFLIHTVTHLCGVYPNQRNMLLQCILDTAANSTSELHWSARYLKENYFKAPCSPADLGP